MLVMLFIISCSIMFTASLAFIPELGGYIQFPYFMKYGISLAWFIFASFYMLFNNKMRIKIKKIKNLIIYTVPAFLMLISIMIAIGTNGLTDAYLSRSLSNILCMFTLLLGVYAATNLFGNKAIDYAFYGLLLSTCINIIYTCYIYGIGNVIIAILNVFKIVGFGYESGSIISNIGYSLEVSDATFAYGFYFIYFLCFCKKGIYRNKYLFLSMLGIYIGLKRIEIFAILIALLIYFCCTKCMINKRYVQNIIFIFFIVISFVFFFLVQNHAEVFSFLDVYRVSLYKSLRSMFTISPFYIGKGYGYVNMWLSDVGASKWILSVSHSEILRTYIELGCMGFIIFIYYYIKFLPNYFIKQGKDRTAIMVLCMTIYIMITYFIDNTLMLFATQFCFMLIPFAEGEGNVQHTKICLGN